jgi:octaprenyl-diphosphate synthase
MQTFALSKEKYLPDLAAKRIFDLIRPELELIEAEYERQANSNIQVINYLGEYLRASGGKRVRPALLILSNNAVGGDGKAENVIRLATVMEMLHTATLVHDDIIDNASVRRSRSSVNARFGNQTAVLMGDWLYMSAYETSLRERSLEILDILTRVTRKMTEGELIQLTVLGKIDLREEEYFDILKRKTAFLFSACCEIGGILGGATDEQQKALRDYGMNLGIAFQLADDALDLTAREDVLGKAVGADLIEGKLTLPLILLLKAEPQMAEVLTRVIHAGEYKGNSGQTIVEGLSQHEIIHRVRDLAYDFAGKARKNLDVFPETRYRSALEEIPVSVIERSR